MFERLDGHEKGGGIYYEKKVDFSITG